MNRIRMWAGGILAGALMAGSAGAQTWTAITSGGVNESNSGTPFWANTSSDGSKCNIGFVIFGGMGSCANGGPTAGRWVGSSPLLSGGTASFVAPGSPFSFAAGSWKFQVLGGWRGYTGGFTTTSPYIGVTDGTTTHKWSTTGTFTVSYGDAFALAMPSYIPSGQAFSSDASVAGKVQYALFSTVDRSPSLLASPLSWTIGDKYIVGFEDFREGDRDYNDVVVMATAVTVPEPASLALVATGLVGLLGVGAARGTKRA